MVLPEAPAEAPSSHGEEDALGAVVRRPSPWWTVLWLLAGVTGSALLWIGAWRADTGREAVLRALAAMVTLLASLAASSWRAGWCERRHGDQREVERLRSQLEALRLGAPSPPGAPPGAGQAPPSALGLPPLPGGAPPGPRLCSQSQR